MPNTTTGSLHSCPILIKRFVTPRPDRNIILSQIWGLQPQSDVLNPYVQKSMASINQLFSLPLSDQDNMAPQGRTGREEPQQYIAPGNPMYSRTYKTIGVRCHKWAWSSEKPCDQEDYLTFSGKVEMTPPPPVLGEAIPKYSCDKADEASTSLLSTTKRKEPLAYLPLAQVVRGTLRSVGDQVQ